VGVNVRTVEGLDVGSLKVRHVDGRGRDPGEEMRDWEEGKKKKKKKKKAKKAKKAQEQATR
jgi:hypothetical protein